MSKGSTNLKKFRFKANFEKAVLSIYEAATTGRGIFEGGYDIWKKKYLPEWRLPLDMEFNPQTEETRKPLEAAEYLWTSLSFERRNKSSTLHLYLHNIWDHPEKRWFFRANEVAKRSIHELREVILGDIHYNLNEPVPKFLANAKKLIKEYGGDPRNTIKGRTVEQARKNLMEFEGIATGNANLAVLHFIHRRLALPTDPENALFKVDIHKARIPLNVEGIVMLNGDKVLHPTTIASDFEQHYWEICKKHKLNPNIADSALWVIGSEVCAKRGLAYCLAGCPLQHNGLCKVNTPLARRQGDYLLFDENGNRPETRREIDQIFFTSLYSSRFK